MKAAISLTLLSSLVLLSGCFSSIMDDDYQKIHPEIRPYVDRFVLEAKARGIEIDITYLKADFGSLHGEASGRTYYQHSIVIIDTIASAWGQKSEELVFHELAHLYLGRGHDNGMLSARYPKSLMSNSTDGNYEYEGNQYRRQYYIDELFNPNTPPPDWAFDYLD